MYPLILILIALITSLYSGTASAAHSSCGGENQKACPAYFTGPPCEQGLRKNDAGKCKPCGGDGERACRVIDKGKQCDSGLIYRAGYCTNRNIACGTEGSPPCHWMKPGARCKDENTATIDGICQSCGTAFNRACPIAERGNNCVSGTKYRKGVCVPNTQDNSAPKSRIYNMSDETILAEIGDWGDWEIEPGDYAEFSVPSTHCIDHSQGFVNPDNETYFNVSYFLDLTQTKCSKYGEIAVWENKADYVSYGKSAHVTTRARYLLRHSYADYREKTLQERTEAVLPGGDLYGIGVRGIIRAPDRDSWVAYWGPGAMEAGRQDSANGTPTGLVPPADRSDPRLRRLYGSTGSQWLICPPDAPADCRSEELLDYPINAVGSWWEYLDGTHIVEFMLMDDEELIAKRQDLNEHRHYRHYEKVGTNRYKSPWNNIYQFTSSNTGYWESAKTGKRRPIRRTRKLSRDIVGMYDGVLRTTINGDTRNRLYTYIVKPSALGSLAPLTHPKKLKVKRLDQKGWEDYEVSDYNTNLYLNDNGSSLRFYESPDAERLSIDLEEGSQSTVFNHIGPDNLDLEGDYKVGNNTFEITKHRKNSLKVDNLLGSGDQTFQRRSRNAYYFRDSAGNVLRFNQGLWYRPKGGSPQRVFRD